MNDDDKLEVLSSGLGLERTAAQIVLNLLNKADCLLWGIGGGVVLATGPLKAATGSARTSASTSALISKNASPVPSRSSNFAMMAVTLGLATVAVGVACSALKLKLSQFLASYASAHEAIRNLTPSKKEALRADARKLLSLKENIEKAFEEEQSGPSPALMA